MPSRFRRYTPALMIGMGRPPLTEAPEFGRRLAEARITRGWTQTELADRLGISVQMMTYYERRATNPATELVRRAAEVLGVTVDELLGTKAPKASRAKPGPASIWQSRVERIRRLPRSQQDALLKVVDGFLDSAERAL